MRRGEHPYQIYAAVFEELKAHPTVLVIDDLHWADQATVDLLRVVLRRIRQTTSLVIGIVRDDEIAPTHPMRSLLGDVARANHATTLTLPPLSLDAVTALSGSGPAYFFYLVDAMIEAGVLLGVPRPLATELMVQTALGSAQMLRETGEHPALLREAVTSPAGTTAAALREFDRRAVRGTILDALVAARDRSVELGRPT